jgi:hypothetical protein
MSSQNDDFGSKRDSKSVPKPAQNAARGSSEGSCQSIVILREAAKVGDGRDPPPLNWSTVRYVFGHEKEDRKCR